MLHAGVRAIALLGRGQMAAGDRRLRRQSAACRRPRWSAARLDRPDVHVSTSRCQLLRRSYPGDRMRLIASQFGSTPDRHPRKRHAHAWRSGYPITAHQAVAFIVGRHARPASAARSTLCYNGFVSPDVAVLGTVRDAAADGGARRHRHDRRADHRRGGVPADEELRQLDTDHWLLMVGIIFIACVMFFPEGIWGWLLRGARDRDATASAMRAPRVHRLNKAFGSLVVDAQRRPGGRRGQRHVIIGPNGAGKTTLLHQIARPDASDRGPHPFLSGRDVTGCAPEARVAPGHSARTFQKNNLFQRLTRARERPPRRAGAPRQSVRPFRSGLTIARLQGARRGGAGAHGLLGRRELPGREPFLWRAAPARDRGRAGQRTDASAARRADLGPVAGRNRTA